MSRDEALLATSELVERAELQRTLADCLLTLEEPYRTTLMHVSFEQRSPAEIAKSEKVSVEVVRRRLRKARELFKEKLERECGWDWQHWYAALLPYAALPLPREAGLPVAESAAATSSVASSTSLVGLLMSHAFVVSTALAITVGVVYFALSDRNDGPSELVGNPGLTVIQTDLATPDRDAQQLDLADGSAPNRMPVTTAQSETSKVPASFFLRGTLVVQDELGVEHAATNGQFALWTSGGTMQVPVIDGLWELAVEADQVVHFRVFQQIEVTTNGRVGEFFGGFGPFEDRRVLTQDTELNLTARWLANSEFVVLDAESREPLSGLTVIEGNYQLQRFAHPGRFQESNVLQRSATSPLIVAPREKYQDAYFIRSAGYAWSRVQVDHRKGGRHEVLLRPGAGDLTVRLRGNESMPTEFRIYDVESEWRDLAFTTSGEDELNFDGLPPGQYVAEARANDRAETVREQFEVLPGLNEVVLDIPKPDVDKLVNVSGILVVPDGWDASDCTLVLCEELLNSLSPSASHSDKSKHVPVSAMTPVEAGEGAESEWLFDAGEHPPGTYNVRLDGLAWRSSFEVSADGTDGLRLEVEAPGEARLHLIDGRTGEVLTDTTRGIRFRLPNGVERNYDAVNQRWRVLAPKGRLSGDTLAEGDEIYAHLDFELGDFPLETEVRLEPRSTLGFLFYEGETRVPVDVVWCFAIQRRYLGAEEGLTFDVAMDGDVVCFKMPCPGSYAITFPALEGYAPIPDVEVEVLAGDHIHHRVQLVRER